MSNQEKTKKKFYKKWWFWVLLVIVFIVIISGSNKPEKIGENKTINTPTVEVGNKQKVNSKQKVFNIGDRVKINDVVVTVNKVEYSHGSAYTKPAEGDEWLNINLTIRNTGSSSDYITTLGQMFVRDGEGNSYQVTATNKFLENPSIGLDGQIIANSKRSGWVGFEIPKKATNLQFQYNTSMFGGGEVLVNLSK